MVVHLLTVLIVGFPTVLYALILEGFRLNWSLGADAEVSARSGPSAATSSSCSAGGRSGAPAPRPLLRIQLSASESGLDAALFMAFELFATLPSARLVAAWGAAWALGRERTGFLESTTSSPEHR